MAKQTYYVSVANHEILDAPLENMELEIYAEKEDLTRLQQLFDTVDQSDKQVTVSRSKTPYERFDTIPAQEDQDIRNEDFDENLTRIYKLIYKLGTPKTRDHIERMDILDKVDPSG